MMTESDKERFNNRLCIGHALISADVYVSPCITESAAQINLTAANDDCQNATSLYNRICNFVLLHGEDLQSLFQTDEYCYMSFFIRNAEAFKTDFESNSLLKPLFNHGKGEFTEYLISFPESP